MFLNKKTRIINLLDSISQMQGLLTNLSDPFNAISDCLAAIEAILFQLSQEDPVPQKTIDRLQNIHHSFETILKRKSDLNESIVIHIGEQIVALREDFDREIQVKLNVVFLPYKASMWDSLATVYEAAVKDENCVATVVPIPYYKLSQEEVIPTYEGELFPNDIPITHFNDYILEEQQPDIIFVHNIYDEYNTITRVHEHFFTSNLKQYTDMLVYVPYHISSFIAPNEETHSLAYDLPTVENVDKIILVGEYLKEAAIRNGVPPEKLLVLGSPKLDAIVNAMKKETPTPIEWGKNLENKTVYLINTGCMFFSGVPFEALERLVDFLSIPKIDERSVVIWRPHPLTKISIMKYAPYLLDYYVNLTEKFIKAKDPLYSRVIFDETEDYIPSLKAADVLISSDGSLLRSYVLTGKKVLFWDEKEPAGSLLPPDIFYYAFDRSEPWYQLVKKFPAGYDPLAKNRINVAANVYENIDGTSGAKIYAAIKECLF
ncbi:hypothetical protein ACFRAM_14410 [Paenibacillus sp. NPDC056722]|uniref:hypothetical protein n=1 Tax=Paenibacillus sp. NPDC056722 TaxID=3345924 RepID=UPI0036A42A4C